MCQTPRIIPLLKDTLLHLMGVMKQVPGQKIQTYPGDCKKMLPSAYQLD